VGLLLRIADNKENEAHNDGYAQGENEHRSQNEKYFPTTEQCRDYRMYQHCSSFCLPRERTVQSLGKVFASGQAVVKNGVKWILWYMKRSKWRLRQIYRPAGAWPD